MGEWSILRWLGDVEKVDRSQLIKQMNRCVLEGGKKSDMNCVQAKTLQNRSK